MAHPQAQLDTEIHVIHIINQVTMSQIHAQAM